MAVRCSPSILRIGTVDVVARGLHETGATMAVDAARRADVIRHKRKIDPTVACIAADTIVLAIDSFLGDFKRMNWLIDDFGLTTGVSFNARLSYRRISEGPHQTQNVRAAPESDLGT